MYRYPCAARLGIAGGIISILISIPAVSQMPTSPVNGIFGIYGQPTPGHDSIQVTKKANERIGVNLKLYYASGHTCRLSQDGKWSQDHIAIMAEGLDSNRPCRLNLFFENHRVLLKDEGSQCARVYCGTRGKLDNASLPKFIPDRE